MGQADCVAVAIGCAVHGRSRRLGQGLGRLRALRAGIGQPGGPKHLLQGRPGVLRKLVQLWVRPVALPSQAEYISPGMLAHMCNKLVRHQFTHLYCKSKKYLHSRQALLLA